MFTIDFFSALFAFPLWWILALPFAPLFAILGVAIWREGVASSSNDDEASEDKDVLTKEERKRRPWWVVAVIPIGFIALVAMFAAIGLEKGVKTTTARGFATHAGVTLAKGEELSGAGWNVLVGYETMHPLGSFTGYKEDKDGTPVKGNYVYAVKGSTVYLYEGDDFASMTLVNAND